MYRDEKNAVFQKEFLNKHAILLFSDSIDGVFFDNRTIMFRIVATFKFPNDNNEDFFSYYMVEVKKCQE